MSPFGLPFCFDFGDDAAVRIGATKGQVRGKGEENGGRVELFVRSGNTDDADASWSEWKRVQTRDGAGDVSEAEKARFFQWRVKLGGGGKNSPLVRRVRVSSLENNLPPLLADVRVVPSGTRFYVDVPIPSSSRCPAA